MGDAGHNGKKDDRGNHHFDQLHETVAKCLDPVILGEVGSINADEYAKNNGDNHLEIKAGIKRLGCRLHRM